MPLTHIFMNHNSDIEFKLKVNTPEVLETIIKNISLIHNRVNDNYNVSKQYSNQISLNR